MIKSLFKRSGIYFLGLIVGKALSVIVFILFARALQPQRFGDFVLFMTFIQLTTVLADCGLNQYYQKQADQSDRRILFGKIIAARLFTLVLSGGILGICILLFHVFSHTVMLFLLMTLIPEAFLSLSDGFYLQNQQALKVALKNAGKIIMLLSGYVLTHRFFSFQWAVVLYFISVMGTICWFLPFRPLHYFLTHVRLSFSGLFHILKRSSSYALLNATSFAYARGDSLIIRYSLNNTALGLYGGAYRYLESLSLIPTALAQNLFPISAQKKGISLKQLKKITSAMTLIGICSALLVFLNANTLIITVLGKAYTSAVPLLKIFALVLLLFFINSPLSTVVQSSLYLNQFLPYGFLNSLVNIICNMLFVPFYGVVAAAWIMAATEMTGLFINVYFIRRIYASQ